MPKETKNKRELLFEIDLSEQTEPNVRMRTGLAKAYAIEGFRLYMDSVIKSASQNLVLALDRDKVEDAKRLANHIVFAQKLVSVARDQYQNLEKVIKETPHATS